MPPPLKAMMVFSEKPMTSDGETGQPGLAPANTSPADR
jgi:hypothetical protein